MGKTCQLCYFLGREKPNSYQHHVDTTGKYIYDVPGAAVSGVSFFIGNEEPVFSGIMYYDRTGIL